MNIVLCASDNYTMPCGVTICSICENNVNNNICFYIISDNLFSNEHKCQLEDIVNRYPDKKINFINVDSTQVSNVLKLENKYYTRHVFYRLFVAELLPQNVNKAIYLDCDVVVRHSLDDFWNIDLENIGVGCVFDSQEAKIDQFNRLEYSYEKGYFNSGVLLINLEYWRQHNIVGQMKKIIQDMYNKIVLPDQDVLNLIFRDSKVMINCTYNFQSGFLYKKKYMLFDNEKYRQEIALAGVDPVILHLSGVRPWIKGGWRHPYESEFFKYRAMTIWKDEPLWKCQDSAKTQIINFLRPFLSKFGLCHVIEDPYDRKWKLKLL